MDNIRKYLEGETDLDVKQEQNFNKGRIDFANPGGDIEPIVADFKAAGFGTPRIDVSVTSRLGEVALDISAAITAPMGPDEARSRLQEIADNMESNKNVVVQDTGELANEPNRWFIRLIYT